MLAQISSLLSLFLYTINLDLIRRYMRLSLAKNNLQFLRNNLRMHELKMHICLGKGYHMKKRS